MTTLPDEISQHKPLIVPSVYDGITALLAREAGFRAVYIGSWATGAARHGLPDIGYIGLEDMADQVRRLAPIVQVPVIVDGEGGWGNPLHVARAVRTLERAGAAATHIEDHDFGKHLVRNPKVIPVGEAVDKIKAALDARQSEDFLIIARTDAMGAEGASGAVDRALAYQEAGADGIMIAAGSALDDATYERLRREITVPNFTIDLPGQSADDHARQGADVVLYYALTHLAAQGGVRAAFDVLAKESSSVSIADEIAPLRGFDKFLGIAAARDQARRYGLLD